MLGKLLNFDWILLISAFLLLSVGLLSLYSFSLSNQGSLTFNVFKRQCIFVALGVIVMIFFAFSNYHYLRSFSTHIYFGALIILVLVLLGGSVIRGTAGWIGIGSFHIQPVELAKLALVIFLAGFISRKGMELGEKGRIIASLILVALMIVLVLKQPDFGSAMILVIVWLGVMIISGISRKFFMVLVLVSIAFSLLVWASLADYQKARIIGFIHPDFDPRGSGYNAIQAKVAVGAGGFWGKGIGHGSQSQLNFLPERHNDFIFAAVAEELGLPGSWFVLVLFFVLFYRMKVIACRAPDNFGYLLVSGIFILYFVQVIVNIGMNLGVFPITGISLPFLSYGGSFLIVTFAALGILLNINNFGEQV